MISQRATSLAATAEKWLRCVARWAIFSVCSVAVVGCSMKLLGCAPAPAPPAIIPTPTPTPTIYVAPKPARPEPTKTPRQFVPYVPHPNAAPILNKVDAGDPRKRIIAEATKLIGTQEKTGHNDGKAVDAILASVGLEGSGAPWCAAANRYIYDKAGLKGKAPRSALASDWVKVPTWKQGEGEKPLPGDAWGIYFASKGRVAHTGIVDTWGKETVVTLEGNTSPEAVAGSARDRDGEGYWRKRRAVRQLYAVKNWLK